MTKTFKITATLGFIGLISGCTIPIADPDNPTRGYFGNDGVSVLEAGDDVPVTKAPVMAPPSPVPAQPPKTNPPVEEEEEEKEEEEKEEVEEEVEEEEEKEGRWVEINGEAVQVFH